MLENKKILESRGAVGEKEGGLSPKAGRRAAMNNRGRRETIKSNSLEDDDVLCGNEPRTLLIELRPNLPDFLYFKLL